MVCVCGFAPVHGCLVLMPSFQLSVCYNFWHRQCHRKILFFKKTHPFLKKNYLFSF